MRKIKKIFTMFLILYPIMGYGQDTIFLNSDMNDVALKSSADYYKILDRNKVDSDKVTERIYYMSGQIKSEDIFINYDKHLTNGVQKTWYKNGQLKSVVDYYYGKIHGTVKTYWENGQLKRNDTYDYDQFISGDCYNSNGIKVDHFNYHTIADFPGGIKKLMKYLTDNLKDPKNASKNGNFGKVVVQFKVGIDGSISNIKIVESAAPDLDFIATRIVTNMPKWSPAFEDGEPIFCIFKLPIIFR